MRAIKVSLSQEDIEKAIRASVVEFGLPIEGREVKITFTSTRKPAGISAEVEIAAPGASLPVEANSGSTSELVSTEPLTGEITPEPEDDGDVDLPVPTPETPVPGTSSDPLFG